MSYYFNDTARIVLNDSIAGPIQSTWAAGVAHSQVWPSLMTYSLPSFDFNISLPAGGLGFLTDPRYTIAQMQWNSMTGQGFGLGANGIFQGFGFGAYPGMNPMGLGLNGLYGGLSGSQGGGSTSSEEAKKDKEEYEDKYNTLNSFLEKLSKSGIYEEGGVDAKKLTKVINDAKKENFVKKKILELKL